MPVNISFIGRINYNDSVKLQNSEKQLVLNGKSSGSIFFLEHFPPVITIGRNGSVANLLKNRDFFDSSGIEIRESSRGGDITAHEPGQLVAYFVLPVESKNAKKFVADITDKITLFLSTEYSIKSEFNDKNPGLWVNNEKICSIGFDLTSGVSMHGIALNVCNTLETFQYIVPCGIRGCTMTTIEKSAGIKTTIDDVYSKIMKYFK